MHVDMPVTGSQHIATFVRVSDIYDRKKKKKQIALTHRQNGSWRLTDEFLSAFDPGIITRHLVKTSEDFFDPDKLSLANGRHPNPLDLLLFLVADPLLILRFLISF